MKNILETIVDHTRIRVAARKQMIPLDDIMKEALSLCREKSSFPFEEALDGKRLSFICEVKKASPSKGMIAQDFPYLEIARAYEKAGAAAISVLTEPDFFLGQDRYLQEIKKAVAIPVLRKDFTIDPYQIYEAKVLGADAVLFICSLLPQEKLRAFIEIADELGLSALVETHDRIEIQRTIKAGARMIGVNNRDLHTMKVNIDTSIRLRCCVPDDILFIAESGISTAGDIARLQAAGVHGVLVGEALMKSGDKALRLKELRGGSGGEGKGDENQNMRSL